MVQVDVFWAYSWGASLAAAAGPDLGTTDPPDKAPKPLTSAQFVKTLLFLALIWAPTGLLLLLRHPSWETMQVAPDLAAMSEWLILGFGITNITQGILGYWVGRRLIESGRGYFAQLNWIAGYFVMFFILLYGWDGLGYDRFLYDRDLLAGSPAWAPGAGTGAGLWASIVTFSQSGVAKTLYLDGVYLVPPFFYLYVTFMRRGAHRALSRTRIIVTYLAGVFGVGFGGAAVAALAVRGVGYGLGVPDHIARALGQADPSTSMHVLSYVIGIPLASAILWWLLLEPGRWVHRWLVALAPSTEKAPAPPNRSQLTQQPSPAAPSTEVSAANEYGGG